MAYANAETCLFKTVLKLCIFLKYLSNCCYSDLLVNGNTNDKKNVLFQIEHNVGFIKFVFVL